MCHCIEVLDKSLKHSEIDAARNTKLGVSIQIDFDTGKSKSTVVILTEKVDQSSKVKAIIIAPSYCPFCGKKYK